MNNSKTIIGFRVEFIGKERKMEDYYCPVCYEKLERLSGCGAVGYMCNTCKNLVSRKKMLSRLEMEEAKKPDNHQSNPEE
jgi:hypothetical protein